MGSTRKMYLNIKQRIFANIDEVFSENLYLQEICIRKKDTKV